MFCSTCGSRVAEGRANCQACGAVVQRPPMPAAIAPATPTFNAAAPMHVCPRCGYRGISAGYFSRGGRIAGLVALALTGIFFPIGVGWVLFRHNHRMCPACGLSWGPNGSNALTLVPGTRGPGSDVVLPAQEGGNGYRGWAIALLIFAAVMVTVGMAATEGPPIVMGLMAAAGGGLLLNNSRKLREQRRENILQSLQLPVLQLAGRKGGRLTVTDVATEMGWPMARAEKVLNSLDDGLRVMSDITDEGVIVYDFVEIRAAQLPGGNDGLRLHA